jgi:hypothetical protein
VTERRLAFALIALALAGGIDCSAKQSVWVPPRIDLREHGTLGLLEIRSATGYGPIATRKLMAALHEAQPGVPILELGHVGQVLRAVGHEALGPDAVRAIGERYRVDAVVVGDLAVEQPKPSFSVHSFTEASASAEIHGTFDARILHTKSGATVWSDSVSGKRTIASVDLAAGVRPRIDAVDPEGEEARLVGWLVSRATRDFSGRWERR